MFIKRRTKLIRSNWRNGIAGVEDALDCISNDERVLTPTDNNQLKHYFDRANSRKESKYLLPHLTFKSLIN